MTFSLKTRGARSRSPACSPSGYLLPTTQCFEPVSLGAMCVALLSTGVLVLMFELNRSYLNYFTIRRALEFSSVWGKASSTCLCRVRVLQEKSWNCGGWAFEKVSLCACYSLTACSTCLGSQACAASLTLPPCLILHVCSNSIERGNRLHAETMCVLQKPSLLEVSDVCFTFQWSIFWPQHCVLTTRDATEACPGRWFRGWKGGLV